MGKQRLKRDGSIWHDRRVKKVSIDAQSERILAVLKYKGNEVAAVLLNFSGGQITIHRDRDKPMKFSGFEVQVIFPPTEATNEPAFNRKQLMSGYKDQIPEAHDA